VDLRLGVTTADGVTLKDVVLEGTELKGGGRRGFDFGGALMHGVSAAGVALRLRIDSISQAPDPRPDTAHNENEDLYHYTVSYQFDSDSSSWTPLCPADEPRPAMPLGGRWDYSFGRRGSGSRISSEPTLATWACEDSALFKCLRFGYKPWRSAPRSPGEPHSPLVSLDELHQSCVRAVRADYCGTGESATIEGHKVDYFDSVGVQHDEADWPKEAEWTPLGARCVEGTRLISHPSRKGTEVREYVMSTCKEVWQACPQGDTRAPRLWTEYNPQTQR
jgi:hypothetical protein